MHVWSLCESQVGESKRAAPGWAKWKFPPASPWVCHLSLLHGRLPFASSPLPTSALALMVVGGDKHVCIGNRRTGDSSGKRGNPPTHTRNPLFFHDDGGFTIRRRPRHLFKFLTASLDSAAPSQRPSIDNDPSLTSEMGQTGRLGSPSWSPISHGICTRMEAPSARPMLGLFPRCRPL